MGGSDVQLLVSLSAQLLVGLSSGWHFLPDGLRSNVALCVVHRLVSPAVGGATASAVSAAAATAGEGGGGPGAALLWPDLLVLCDPGCLWLRRLCARGPASKALAAAVAQGGSTAQALVNAAVRAAAESDLTRADAPAALRRVLLIHVFGCALASSSVMRSLPGSAPDAFMRQLVRAVAPDADDDDKNSGRGSRGGGGGGPLVEQSCAAAAEHLLLTSSLWPGHFTTAIVGEALVACEQRLRRVAAGIRAGADSFAGSVWVVSSLAAPLLQLCSAPGGPALLASCWDHVCSSSHAACDCLAACGPEWSQDAAEGVCDVISLACRILAASPPLGETQDDGPNRRPPLAAHILAAVLTCMQSSPPRVVEHAMAALQPLATSASGVALLASSAPQAVPPLAAWLVNSLTTRPGAAVDSTGGGRDIPGQEASGRDAADSAWSSARDVDSLLATASFVALIPSGFAALVAAGLFEALLRPVLALLRAGEESRVLLQLAGPRDAPQLAPLLRLQHFCSWQGAARQLASYNLSAGPGTASSGVSGEGGTMLDALLLAGAATVTPTQPGASSAAGAAGGGMTGLEVLAAVMDPAVAASVLSADPEDTSLAVLRCMSVWATDPDALQAVASCPPLLRQLRRLVPGGTAAASAAASAQGGSLKAADSIGAATPYAAWLAQALRAPLAGREGAAFPSSATPSRQGAGAAGVLGGKAQRQQQQSQASALQRMLDAGSANGAPGSRQWLDAARAALVRDVTAGVELPPAAIWQLLPQQLPPAPPPATAAVAPPAAAEQAPPAGGAAAAAAASVALAAAALADPGPRGVEARQLPAACPELLLAQPRAASTEQLTRLVDFLSKSAPSAASEQQQLEVSQLTDVWQCVQHLAAPGQAGSSSGGRTRNRTAPADMFALVALHAVGSVSAARELLQRLSQVPAGHRLSALWPAHAQRIIGGTATLALCRLTERLLLAHAPHIFHALQASGCNAAQLVARWYRSWFCGALPVEEARGVLALAAAAEADSDVVLARVMVACFKHIDRGGALLRHAAEGTLLPWLHSLDPLEGFRLANCDVAALLGATTH